MKHHGMLAVILCGILLTEAITTLKAQNYLYKPESICYDSQTKKYYVSSLMNGLVVEIDSKGSQTVILNDQTQCAGNVIRDNILYFSSQKNVKAYNISSIPPVEVMNIYISDAKFLDGMTLDSSGYLYVCDNGYPNFPDKIYKIDLAAHAYWVFVPGGRGLTVSLQDLVFDMENNRLISASANYSNSIQSIRLSDSTVTNISSQVRLIDGITRDSEGNYYFTSWYSHSLHKFNSSFSGSAVVIADNLNGPSQPCFNPDRNLVAVPLFDQNEIAYVQLQPIGINGSPALLKDFRLIQNYPNPFNPVTKIRFDILASPYSSQGVSNVNLIIYDILGREIEVLFNGSAGTGNSACISLGTGSYEVTWDGSNYPSGVYFYRLITDHNFETRKMELVK